MSTPSHNNPRMQKAIAANPELQDAIDTYRAARNAPVEDYDGRVIDHGQQQLAFALRDALRALSDTQRVLDRLHDNEVYNAAVGARWGGEDVEKFVADSLRYTRAAHAAVAQAQINDRQKLA